MKIGNIALSLGIGLYFSVSVNTLFWSDFYYTVIVGFCCLALSEKKIEKIDEYFGKLIIGLIWLIYVTKPCIEEHLFKKIRFSDGILFVVLGIIYSVYCIVRKLQHDN